MRTFSRNVLYIQHFGDYLGNKNKGTTRRLTHRQEMLQMAIQDDAYHKACWDLAVLERLLAVVKNAPYNNPTGRSLVCKA